MTVPRQSTVPCASTRNARSQALQETERFRIVRAARAGVPVPDGRRGGASNRVDDGERFLPVKGPDVRLALARNRRAGAMAAPQDPERTSWSFHLARLAGEVTEQVHRQREDHRR